MPKTRVTALLCLLGACAEAPGSQRKESGESALDTSGGAQGGVLVIGAGPAGLAVASEVDALLLEAAEQSGGHMRFAGTTSFFNAIPEQEERGLVDSLAMALEDWPALTGAPPTDATRAFLEASPAIRDRLVDMGFTLLGPKRDPILHRPRYFDLQPQKDDLVALLEADLDPGSELRLSTPVSRVLVEDGRVRGVDAGGEILPARVVVVATGGYGSRADLISGVPDDEGTPWGASETGWAGNGQALDWAREGAWGTASLESIGWFRDNLGVLTEAGTLYAIRGSMREVLWVDMGGHRFVDETEVWSVSLSVPQRAHLPSWGLLSRRSLDALAEAKGAGPVRVAIDAGERIVCRSDPEALALAVGIDADGLAATLAEVAAVRAGGGTDAFGRASDELPDLSGEICAFVPGRCSGKTFGGLAVDDAGRVLDTSGRVIEGLWSAGEAAGMAIPGMSGRAGLDGSITAVLWSGWRVGAAIHAELEATGDDD
jgi:hypothetical protein